MVLISFSHLPPGCRSVFRRSYGRMKKMDLFGGTDLDFICLLLHQDVSVKRDIGAFAQMIHSDGSEIWDWFNFKFDWKTAFETGWSAEHTQSVNTSHDAPRH